MAPTPWWLALLVVTVPTALVVLLDRLGRRAHLAWPGTRVAWVLLDLQARSVRRVKRALLVPTGRRRLARAARPGPRGRLG